MRGKEKFGAKCIELKKGGENARRFFYETDHQFLYAKNKFAFYKK
ncbi:hypothetical protein OUM_0017 [Helicobacter pylori R038b]|uniref:Uncharacterized protein n=1 Tax=Helicobacter pylori R038b TaxID=1145115 RepID=K2LS67_HELPX|nr:hypothetical protein OUM_0017 [Helicobacter pylori R038b]